MIKFTILIITTFSISVSAQIYTPSGKIQGGSGGANVGIGTASPMAKLQVDNGNTCSKFCEC